MTDSKISVEKRKREREREKWSTTATATSRAAPTQVNGDCNRVLFNKKRERERDKCKSIRREGKNGIFTYSRTLQMQVK